jgi:orotidine-5'-phosphate decarboxylase
MARLILALDLPDRRSAEPLLSRLRGSVDVIKVGMQLFYAEGRPFVEEIASMGFRIFLDLKLHDIPNTVASAVHSVSNLPIHMLTVHASGGPEMLRAAVQAAAGRPDLTLLGVTVLTSSNQATLDATGVRSTPEEQVLRLGSLAADAGLGGLVCSPLEIGPLRAKVGPGVQLVVPGVRPADAPPDDQKRTLTPSEAARAGADYLVIGRPILKAADPAEAARRFALEAQAT